MSFQQWFTEEDPRIVGSLQSDPLGLRVVWSGLAHNVFRFRVNSITNDLRAYTINLFHCWVVKQIRMEMDPSAWSESYRSKFQLGSSPKFTRSLLVFLEKVMLYAFCSTKREINAEGLIGFSNASRRYLEEGKKFPLLLDDVEGEILVRQVQLGFSGRYRTAFTQHLKLLHPESGHPVDCLDTWSAVNNEFMRRKNFAKLSMLLRDNVRVLLARKNADIRQADIDSEIFDLYVQCFGKRATLDKEFSPFWHPILSFDIGETRWLWQTLETYERSAATVFRSALEAARKAKADMNGNEIKGLRHVCEVEPYLARISRIFDALLNADFRKGGQCADWMNMRYGERPLVPVFPSSADEIGSAISGEGQERLRSLLRLRELSAPEIVERIVEYHADVSEYRAARPWIRLVGQHLDREVEIKASRDYDENEWVHDYHASQFVGLASSLKAA
ncbi:hypothetical protein [Aromatoleum evansii]|uniref:hypothetical protein n=1 Tax=Aromatoleum evansii TaxID=59406 RepID=UPI00145EE43B|nr:hypothetical protein [Aromatoleum evansii]NMG31753.1 hypothetical protein [Aromatoleum evansii]